jgi:hypothetical protein
MVVYDPGLLATDQVRLWLRRPAGPDHYETITSVDGRTAVLMRLEADTARTDEAAGLVLPRGVAEAIADAVRPGPSEEAMIVLRQQLEVERGRVDRMLDGQVRTRLQPGDRTPVDRPNPTRAS